MPSITLLIPSRGRPHRFKTAVDSARQTASEKIEVISYFDDDDPMLSEYPEYHIVGRRVRTAKAILTMLQDVTTPYAMLGADDIVFRTPGWDVKMLSYMPADDLGVVYGMDGWKNSMNHFLFSMKWHRLVGVFPDGMFDHFGPDTWVSDIAKECGRLFQAKEVLIEHHHTRNNKAPDDATYRERGKPADYILEATKQQRSKIASVINAAIAREAQ